MFEYLSSSSWALVLFLLIFFLLVSILYSLLSTVVKYFDFKLFRIEDTYRIEAGLINKRNVIVPHNKVQQLNWETGPIKQLFGIYHLILKQAVSGQNIKAKAVDAPGCLNEHLKQLKTDLFGEDLISELPKIYSNRYYFWKIWIIFAWTPVAIASPFLYSEWLFWLGVLIWLLICGGYTLLLLNKLYFQINNKQILISSGAITHKWKQMELYKIQSVEFKQNIFQKRRSIASLQLMNASGTLTIPYINDTLAKEIYNYLLYHTEISEKSWM
jgi:putative membrane protein